MFNVFRSLLLMVAVALLCSCSPRGESKSLSEVYEAARARYAAVNSVAAGVSELAGLEQGLLALVDNPKADTARSISDTLRTLIARAGYTSRPALGELIEQYQNIAFESSEMPVNQSRAKLLAARTYNLLARELETTSFRL